MDKTRGIHHLFPFSFPLRDHDDNHILLNVEALTRSPEHGLE